MQRGCGCGCDVIELRKLNGQHASMYGRVRAN